MIQLQETFKLIIINLYSIIQLKESALCDVITASFSGKKLNGREARHHKEEIIL